MHLHFGQALLPSGWVANVRITVDGTSIARVETAEPRPGDQRHGIGLPGLANLHSHGFQRGMAGLAEYRGEHADDFWTWREVMYRFLGAMTPDDVQAVTAQAYAEMLQSGFTRVAEFHYLHHDPAGLPYADPAEMAAAVAAAAERTGIGLTLLPVFYAHAGFGGLPPNPGQRRFINRLDDFAALLAGSRAAIAHLPGANLGVAPHSLRAVTPDQLAVLADMLPDAKLHMHIAEQTREVEDCLAWSGARPVCWLLDHVAVGPRWCLIHATHMDAEETAALARTGATAGLCPITEANLGDGIFPGSGWRAAGGAWGVGTDSNVLIGAAAELRQLEYAQRLGPRARNVMADRGSTGRALFAAAWRGGNAACGLASHGLAAGAAADIVALAARPGDVDGWIFAGTGAVDAVWVGGRALVVDGRHIAAEAIAARFGAALERLLG